MNIIILGGGLSGLSLAYFLQNRKDIDKIDVLEKEERPGGLCRTFSVHGMEYDVGPHIFFSKDKEALDFLLDMLGDNKVQLRRSNRILHKGIFVQYPFENDLSKLPLNDKEYAVNAFIDNPYRNYEPKNMLQFFLKTFGEGITNLYLRPYNEKIWKFEPTFMDTQMVRRIPNPSKDDILRSVAGETVDGYKHQLYFSYPKTGGTEVLIKGILARLNKKVRIYCDAEVKSVEKSKGEFRIVSTNGELLCDRLVSTIPLDEFTALYSEKKPGSIAIAASGLRHNSIAIVIVNTKMDKAGHNYAFTIADKNVQFHRLSKLDFLGKHYQVGGVTYMVEITYRKGDLTDLASNEKLLGDAIDGLKHIGFVSDSNDVNFMDVRRFDYAYVIYDLNHRRNVDTLCHYFTDEGILLNGRFGSFEYLNMDAIVRQSMNLAKSLMLTIC
jgi:protoporphyrinogen oxidase